MKTKFEIGDTLYYQDRDMGKVQEIIIKKVDIYYIFERSENLIDCLYPEKLLSKDGPPVMVPISLTDVKILHQFFGEMSVRNYNEMVKQQGIVDCDISSDVVGDVPSRMYVLLDNILKQK